MSLRFQQVSLPRGMEDLFSERYASYVRVYEVAKRCLALYGFDEVQIPCVEYEELFRRPLGLSSDIVSKEMYVFSDRSGGVLALRPEGTAGVVRAFIRSGLSDCRAFYYGPMFRYERPQRGRRRQFYQIGVESLGKYQSQRETEVLMSACDLLKQLGLSDECTLYVNSLGEEEERKNYALALVSYFSRYVQDLSADSQRRLQDNPLRILDSKEEKDQEIVKTAPLMSQFLSSQSLSRFDRVCSMLSVSGMRYVHDERLVRGLDYYSHLVFEFKDSSQLTLLAGGSYSGLLTLLGGGVGTDGVGWAAGVDRMALLLEDEPVVPHVEILIAQDVPLERALRFASYLRARGIRCGTREGGSLKKLLHWASKLESISLVVFFTAEDLEDLHRWHVKDLSKGQQWSGEGEDALFGVICGCSDYGFG